MGLGALCGRRAIPIRLKVETPELSWGAPGRRANSSLYRRGLHDARDDAHGLQRLQYRRWTQNRHSVQRSSPVPTKQAGTNNEQPTQYCFVAAGARDQATEAPKRAFVASDAPEKIRRGQAPETPGPGRGAAGRRNDLPLYGLDFHDGNAFSQSRLRRRRSPSPGWSFVRVSSAGSVVRRRSCELPTFSVKPKRR